MGQGQRSLGLRSKVTFVKVRQILKILAGWLTSTSSCIFLSLCNIAICFVAALSSLHIYTRHSLTQAVHEGCVAVLISIRKIKGTFKGAKGAI